MTCPSTRRWRWLHGALVAALALLLSAFGCGGGGNATGGTPDPVVPAFNATRAFADLQTQVDFGPRAPGSAGHTACRNWLLAQLQARTGDVTQQDFSFTTPGDTTFQFANLVAVFNPAGAPLSDALLLGAHWDTRPVADQDPDPAKRNQPILGANDGASGVAVLLELARHLQAAAPPRPVILVLFDFEDGGNTPLTTGQPLSGFSIGARHFAANIGRFRPREVIVVDMVGDPSLSLPREQNSVTSHPTLVDHVWQTAQSLGFTAFQNRLGLAITDDHIPLINIGVPAIDIIDFDYPGPNNHSFWHTTHDTPDNCRPESLRAVGQTLLNVIYD
ncbi:MAG: M28 family peptidase [Fimbriimonadaceae bacterium]|nr:M28 family peptidase [Fimbriimonadaceae bacterium]